MCGTPALLVTMVLIQYCFFVLHMQAVLDQLMNNENNAVSLKRQLAELKEENTKLSSQSTLCRPISSLLNAVLVYMYDHVCVCVNVCVYVYVCMCVCVYMCIYVCVYYVCMNVFSVSVPGDNRQEQNENRGDV